jgi:hypothetical protein
LGSKLGQTFAVKMKNALTGKEGTKNVDWTNFALGCDVGSARYRFQILAG